MAIDQDSQTRLTLAPRSVEGVSAPKNAFHSGLARVLRVGLVLMVLVIAANVFSFPKVPPGSPVSFWKMVCASILVGALLLLLLFAIATPILLMRLNLEKFRSTSSAGHRAGSLILKQFILMIGLVLTVPAAVILLSASLKLLVGFKMQDQLYEHCVANYDESAMSYCRTALTSEKLPDNQIRWLLPEVRSKIVDHVYASSKSSGLIKSSGGPCISTSNWLPPSLFRRFVDENTLNGCHPQEVTGKYDLTSQEGIYHGEFAPNVPGGGKTEMDYGMSKGRFENEDKLHRIENLLPLWKQSFKTPQGEAIFQAIWGGDSVVPPEHPISSSVGTLSPQDQANLQMQRKLAFDYFRARNWNAALVRLNGILMLVPNDREALNLQAICSLKRREDMGDREKPSN